MLNKEYQDDLAKRSKYRQELSQILKQKEVDMRNSQYMQMTYGPGSRPHIADPIIDKGTGNPFIEKSDIHNHKMRQSGIR